MKSVERVLHQREETMRVPQQQSRDLWYQTSIAGVTTAEDDCIALYDDLKAQTRVLRVKVPPDDSTNDDYAGPLVKCTHHLEIRIKTEDHVDDPRVQVPLQFKQFQTCSQRHTVLRKQSMMMAPRAHRGYAETKKTSLRTSTTASQENHIPERQGHADIRVPSYGEHSGNEVMASHGFSVCVGNRSTPKVETTVQRAKDEGGLPLVGAMTTAECVARLSKPRKVVILVQAGKSFDDTIAQLSAYMEHGNVIIDGGNEWHPNSIRRSKFLEPKGIHFIGMGISGVEEGARNGPSLMPGGPKAAYDLVAPVLPKSSAPVLVLPTLVPSVVETTSQWLTTVSNTVICS
jgi:hypothetical protein